MYFDDFRANFCVFLTIILCYQAQMGIEETPST